MSWRSDSSSRARRAKSSRTETIWRRSRVAVLRSDPNKSGEHFVQHVGASRVEAGGAGAAGSRHKGSCFAKADGDLPTTDTRVAHWGK